MIRNMIGENKTAGKRKHILNTYPRPSLEPEPKVTSATFCGYHCPPYL